MSRSEKRRVQREQLHAVLQHGQGRLGHAVQFAIVMVILTSIAVLPLMFLPSYNYFENSLHIIEAVIVSLFTVEYLLRLYAAPVRWRYIFSFYGIIDLLSIMPFYAGIFGVEYIRAIHLVRIFKLAEIEAPGQKKEAEIMQREIGLMDGEVIEYVVSKSPLVLFIGVIPSIVSVSFGLGAILEFEGPVAIATATTLFIFALLFLWKTWLDFSYDVIYVTNYRLILQNQHILGRSFNQVSYNSITNVKPYYPGPLSYILRFGSLVIDTAAEHPGQIGLHTVRRHEKAAQTIMKKCFENRVQGAQIGVNAQANM